MTGPAASIEWHITEGLLAKRRNHVPLVPVKSVGAAEFEGQDAEDYQGDAADLD